MKTISIIIPTLNEETYISKLLKSIQQQTCLPLEVIVADAGSSDQTAEIALQAGCRVVPGGRPARGRNAGASAARGDIFLFLDADVVLPPDFLANILDEFNRRKLDVATCLVKPMGGNMTDIIFHETANIFIQSTQSFNPHAPGCCILSRRQIHETIEGFDESLYLSEDHDYVRRAFSHRGRFGILHKPIPISTRRFETDGHLNVAMRYSFLAINQIIGDPFDQAAFDRFLGGYRFGHYSKTMPRRRTRRNIDFQRANRLTASSIRQAVDVASQQTFQFIDNNAHKHKALRKLFQNAIPSQK